MSSWETKDFNWAFLNLWLTVSGQNPKPLSQYGGKERLIPKGMTVFCDRKGISSHLERGEFYLRYIMGERGEHMIVEMIDVSGWLPLDCYHFLAIY